MSVARSTKSLIDTLWYTRCPVPTPLGIAAQLGWIEGEFKQDGIEVRTLQDAVEPSIRDSHFDHRLDNSFRQGGNIPAIWARANGRATRVVGLTWTDEAQVILVLPDSKIRGIGDLKGKKLGVVVDPSSLIDFWRATTLRAYVAALGLEGLRDKDVEFVNLVRPERPASERLVRGFPPRELRESIEGKALLSGQVDAIFHKGSRGLELAEAIGAKTIYDIGKHPDPKVRVNNGSPRTLTVDSGLLDHHPELAARLVKQVLLAGRWAEENPAETIAYIAKETGSSAEAVRLAYARNVNHHLKTDLEESSIAALSEFKDFLLAWDFIPRDFDVREWIDPRPLEAAKRLLLNSQATPANVAPATL